MPHTSDRVQPCDKLSGLFKRNLSKAALRWSETHPNQSPAREHVAGILAEIWRQTYTTENVKAAWRDCGLEFTRHPDGYLQLVVDGSGGADQQSAVRSSLLWVGCFYCCCRIRRRLVLWHPIAKVLRPPLALKPQASSYGFCCA
jgi:hypothetical protein